MGRAGPAGSSHGESWPFPAWAGDHFLFLTLKPGAGLLSPGERWGQIPGCPSPSPLPTSGVAKDHLQAVGMEQAKEEKLASVSNLVTVFENSRYWAAGGGSRDRRAALGPVPSSACSRPQGQGPLEPSL